jgi:1,4-dihydroxy-2-naphthoyl-CoA synthase
LCENIDAYTALDWGLVNEVVPYSMLDAAVETLAQKLYNKLPECTRYTKQQLNFWRDFSWSMTIGHARDWLTLHAGESETLEGLKAFKRKTDMDYAKIRGKAAGPASPLDSQAELATCPSCNEQFPNNFKFCGACGEKLG